MYFHICISEYTCLGILLRALELGPVRSNGIVVVQVICADLIYLDIYLDIYLFICVNIYLFGNLFRYLLKYNYFSLVYSLKRLRSQSPS